MTVAAARVKRNGEKEKYTRGRGEEEGGKAADVRRSNKRSSRPNEIKCTFVRVTLFPLGQCKYSEFSTVPSRVFEMNFLWVEVDLSGNRKSA